MQINILKLRWIYLNPTILTFFSTKMRSFPIQNSKIVMKVDCKRSDWNLCKTRVPKLNIHYYNNNNLKFK